jgi:N-acyl-L-homoserine lactone synthetase
MLVALALAAALRELVVLVAVAMAQKLRRLHLGLQTLAAVVEVGTHRLMAHKAAPVS